MAPLRKFQEFVKREKIEGRNFEGGDCRREQRRSKGFILKGKLL
jgi:hypothetical protein